MIDASGTLGTPNPAGAAGLPAIGEGAARERIYYGMPDLLGADRKRYAGRRILVLGAGHSAVGTLLDAVRLREKAPGTQIHWAVRQPDLRKVLGGGGRDQLAERGRLGVEIVRLVEEGSFTVHLGFNLDHLSLGLNGLVAADDQRELPPVDELVVAAGYRPDLSLLSEIRLALDPGTQSPVRLAPLIDPNQHSCGTVPPHGAEELRHPEEGFYLVGMKSYGRAPTFLMRTGYEQVRSVAAALAGDWEAARRVELALPATGVCSTDRSAAKAGSPAAGCCGGAAPTGVDACCAADAQAKEAGAEGCGCAAPEPVVSSISRPAAKAAACCGGRPPSAATRPRRLGPGRGSMRLLGRALLRLRRAAGADAGRPPGVGCGAGGGVFARSHQLGLAERPMWRLARPRAGARPCCAAARSPPPRCCSPGRGWRRPSASTWCGRASARRWRRCSTKPPSGW